MDRILSFDGDYRFLSNFYPCPIAFEGIRYPSVEHAYQAAKTTDMRERVIIQQCPAPGKAKLAGKRMTMRKDWPQIKRQVMARLLRQKFHRGGDLAERLKGTQPAELVEHNTWNDTFWGVCNGQGANHLGRILMEIRTELIAPSLFDDNTTYRR